ncbi:hypothetical protein [Clostridium aminobutyricum]|uniref:Uncharacterized protein n=1 Tax=Clostridium aminobutyricum TaxID=33953 RepID=A0A939D7Z5_CLOAM|nr:hypothetical protein [Clostridium aminobutyricum]MBN7772478.1 hypothetical protein [Clostridium aminobutyricum]
MKSRIIIYISIFGFLTAIILSNIKEIQNNEYIDDGMQQVNGQLEEDDSTTLFKYLPVEW